MRATPHPRRRGAVAIVVAAVLFAAGFAVAVAVSEALAARAEIAELGLEWADRDLAMAWCARVLLVLTIAWIVIGMLSARTRLVRRPGAAAARASWVSSTRPWRAVESMLGMLPADRVLLIAVPAALLVATRAVQTSVLSWAHLAVVLVGWVTFLTVVLLVARKRSAWPVIAAVGGVIVLRCAVTLVALSLSGPGGYLLVLQNHPLWRTIGITIAFALFVWLFVAAGWTLSLRWGHRRATGIVLAGFGAGVAVAALAVAAFERVLVVWSIPVSTALYVAVAGAVMSGAGALLSLRWARA